MSPFSARTWGHGQFLFCLSLVRAAQRGTRRVTCFELWLGDQAGDVKPARYSQLGILDDRRLRERKTRRPFAVRWSALFGPAGTKNETILGLRIRDQKWSHFPSPQYRSLCKSSQGAPFVGSDSETKSGLAFWAQNSLIQLLGERPADGRCAA